MDLILKNCCNLLNTLPLKLKCEVLHAILKPQTIWSELLLQFHTQNTYSIFFNIQKSMDTFSERCIKESIKNTMLKHEETFKQQLCELHRLYQVQKKLMAELKVEELRNKSFLDTSNPQIATDTIDKLHSSRTSSEATHSSHTNDGNISKPELAKFPEPLRISKGYILQHHIEGDSVVSFPNDDECNLDLSLSIGCASEKMKSSNWKDITKGSTPLLSSNLILEENGKECTNSSGGFGGAESLKRPHWLFQALSLNRT